MLSLSFRAENPKVADVFIKKGPYLKLYTTYIKDFEKLTAELEDACNRYPNFKAAVKEFEVTKNLNALLLIDHLFHSSGDVTI